MWDFFGIIIEQLSETFKWFFTGFFGIIAILILSYKNNLLPNSGSIAFIKKVSYYLFFPLYIGILSWFLSATIIVEKNAKEVAHIAIEKAEDSVFPHFYNFILSYTDDWIDSEVNSKKELVDSYLKKNDYKEGSISTQVMEWTLINGIDYIEDKAIENGDFSIGDEKINIPKLISNYLNDANGTDMVPFQYLKGLSFKAIHGYAKSFYWLYFWMALVVFFILGMDVYFHLKKKEHKFINPNETLGNSQDKLENSIKELDGVKKIE